MGFIRKLSLLFITLIALQSHQADAKAFLRLPSIFSRDMVLQREKPVVIWGVTTGNTTVNITLNNENKVVTSEEDGKWEVAFSPLTVGGPYEMTVATTDTVVTYSNILSGDVWICSGQSNMAWQFMNDQFYEEESTNTDIPNLRTIRIPARISVDSLNPDLGDTYWLKSYLNSSRLFSAVGFYFGRKLAIETGVPIGMIGSYWGGSPIEAWMSKEGLDDFSEFKPFIEELEAGSVTAEELNIRAEENLLLKQQGIITDPAVPTATQHFPTAVYNGMIAPLVKFPVKGVIWDQGGGNAARAWQYYSLFPAMIKDWRQKFNNPEMPFYFVQLSTYGIVRDYPFDPDRAQIRDAHNNTFLTVPNTEQVVTLDVGDCNDLHPRNKRTVGYRFANLALKNLYGVQGLNPEFPRLKSYSVENGSIICEFDHVGSGLQVKGGELTEFAIAGENEIFLWATATIIAPDKIKLSSPYVPEPVALRYAWSYCPQGGLVFNSHGLPLPTFRTDSFRISTQPIDSNQSDTIVLKTAKAANSEITLLLSASGEGEVKVDWGDGNAQTIQNVSSLIGSPTTIKGVIPVNQAEIKILTQNRPIVYLNCATNELTSLDVTRAPLLQSLRCYTNKLTTIDLTNNKDLATLLIYQNSLTSLDVSNNSKLGDLQFGTNKIATLTGLNKLTVLRTLSGMSNPLKEVDVSKNPSLQFINLRNCGLKELDLSKATSALTTVEVFNSGPSNANNFDACGLDAIYRSLTDRTGMTKGVVRVIYSTSNPLFNDGAGSNKQIANNKNWEVSTYVKETLNGDGAGCPNTGFNNISLKENIKLIPNPTRDKVKIQVPETQLDEKLSFHDVLGKKIKEIIVNTTLIEVNIGNFKSGLYLIRSGNYASVLMVQ